MDNMNPYQDDLTALMGVQGVGTPEEQQLANSLRGQRGTADFLAGSTIESEQAIGQRMRNDISKGAQQYGSLSQAKAELASRESEGQKNRAHQILRDSNNDVFTRGQNQERFAHDMLMQGNSQDYGIRMAAIANDYDKEANKLEAEYRRTNNVQLHEQSLALQADAGRIREEAAVNQRSFESRERIGRQEFEAGENELNRAQNVENRDVSRGDALNRQLGIATTELAKAKDEQSGIESLLWDSAAVDAAEENIDLIMKQLEELGL